MSYCRFSSDNWKSDVYAYANVDGNWTVHIAGQRITQDLPDLDYSLLTSDTPDVEAFTQAYNANIAAVQTASRSPIEHPLAGQTRNFDSPGELAAFLEQLTAEGLHVPAGVVSELRAEQSESDAKE